MNCTLIPVCSNLFPSLGRTVTVPLTDSPSMYKGAFSLLFLSSFMSTTALSSVSSRTMSISTAVPKKSDMSDEVWNGSGGRAGCADYLALGPYVWGLWCVPVIRSTCRATGLPTYPTIAHRHQGTYTLTCGDPIHGYHALPYWAGRATSALLFLRRSLPIQQGK